MCVYDRQNISLDINSTDPFELDFGKIFMTITDARPGPYIKAQDQLWWHGVQLLSKSYFFLLFPEKKQILLYNVSTQQQWNCTSPLNKEKNGRWKEKNPKWILSLSFSLCFSFLLYGRYWPFRMTLAELFLLPTANHPWNLFRANRDRDSFHHPLLASSFYPYATS